MQAKGSELGSESALRKCKHLLWNPCPLTPRLVLIPLCSRPLHLLLLNRFQTQTVKVLVMRPSQGSCQARGALPDSPGLASGI